MSQILTVIAAAIAALMKVLGVFIPTQQERVQERKEQVDRDEEETEKTGRPTSDWDGR